jgi:hypothetical protein
MVEGSVTEVSAVHAKKAPVPEEPPDISVNPSGRTRLFKPVHLANAFDGMEVMLFGMVIAVSAVHPTNMSSPSTEHPSGIITVFKAVLPLKVDLPTLDNPLGRVTEISKGEGGFTLPVLVKISKLANAESPISVTLSGITTLVIALSAKA